MTTLSKTKFKVEIEGLDGLSSWLAVEGIRFGHQVSHVYSDHTLTPTALPGKASAGPIVLTRAFDGDKKLAEWAKAQAMAKRNGSVIFVDYTGKEKLRFNWSHGWVSDYRLGDMDATAAAEGPNTETITIQVEEITPAFPAG